MFRVTKSNCSLLGVTLVLSWKWVLVFAQLLTGQSPAGKAEESDCQEFGGGSEGWGYISYNLSYRDRISFIVNLYCQL